MVSPEIYHEVDVTLPNTTYRILIGRHLLQNAAPLLDAVAGRQVLIVTNETIAPFYLEGVRQIFKGLQCDVVILPDGEAHKTQLSVSTIHEILIAHNHHRDTTLIALGGGVIGDLTGFAASTYQRGVDYIQLPTTLLAAVDASIGGKTAINYPGAKNVVGCFHQPKAVFIDIACFDTLALREFQAGFAEVIKYALLSGDLTLPSKPLPELIAQCCEIKARMIASDVTDKAGTRALLNLGHTFAHALEAYTHYERWLHGEAVAIGLYYAARLSEMKQQLDASIVKKLDDLLAHHGLPRRIPTDISLPVLYELMRKDKKATMNQVPFVLMKDLGRCYLDNTVTLQDIKKMMA